MINMLPEDEGDCGKEGAALVEAEDECVEIALEILSSHAVIDAEHNGLGVGKAGAVSRRF